MSQISDIKLSHLFK